MKNSATERFLAWDDLDGWSARRWGALILLLSTAFAVWLYRVWPIDYRYDDGAIVLRYMDNFAAGGFFRYNLEDPAVFGISGFLHGALSGLLSASALVTPDQSVLISNGLGVGLTSLAILLLLRCFSRSLLTLLAGWAFCLCSANYFLQTSFQGLEAPLHLGLVLLTCWAFLAGRRRTMWLLLALATISKLDAVPVVGLLACLRLLTLLVQSPPRATWLAELRTALVWGALPLGVWVLFSVWLFGSPLPQSAFAKLYFHYHYPSRLAFVSQWWKWDGSRMQVQGLVALGVMLLSFWRRGLREGLALVALPAGCVALLVLFSFYNPGERMPWYYVMPQTLLILAAATAVLGLQRWLRPSAGVGAVVGIVVPVLLFAGLIPSSLASSLVMLRRVQDYITTTEPERIAVGQYIFEQADPSDRLYAGHGHIARFARIYTYDYSGLNSPLITQLRQENKGPLRELKPEWVARHGVMAPQVQAELRYDLRATFYGISYHGRPAWRVWRRLESTETAPLTRALAGDEVESDGQVRTIRDGLLHIRGHRRVVLTCGASQDVEQLRVGVVRQEEPLVLQVTLLGGGESLPDRPLTRVTVPAVDLTDLAGGWTYELQVTLPPGTAAAGPVRLQLTPVTQAETPGEFRLLEPVWRVAGLPLLSSGPDSKNPPGATAPHRGA